MAHINSVSLMKSMDWLRKAADASTYVASYVVKLVLPTGTIVFTTDAMARNLNRMVLQPMRRVPIVRAIWEIDTLMAGIVLGLVIVYRSLGISFSSEIKVGCFRKIAKNVSVRSPIISQGER